jgi:WD40 repeat protein/biotin carboxyl carrier protein
MKTACQTLTLALVCLGTTACDRLSWPGQTRSNATVRAVSTPTTPKPQGIGEPLYVDTTTPALPAPVTTAAADPIVIPNCHLAVINKEDVPSRHEGVIRYVGTPLKPGEQAPVDRIITLKVNGKAIKIRQLKEGDMVRAGQILAQLDDSVQQDDLAIKIGHVKAAQADLQATLKTRDEAKWRYDQEVRAASNGIPGVTSLQDVRGMKLSYERLVDEAVSKQEAVHLAELERDQAQTVVSKYQIRSSIAGVVKAIHRKPGEAVKMLDVVVTIQDLSHLRAEGYFDGQFINRIRSGMSVAIEPAVQRGPIQEFIGHLQDVTAVAVTNETPPRIVSTSEDGSIRVWNRLIGHEQIVIHNLSAVRAVACTPPSSGMNWCLSGDADGVGRLWELTENRAKPLRELKGEHHGAITCVAFSPDGKQCATGGEDCEICVFDTATGRCLYHLPLLHRGPITSIQFTPQAGLVSASIDNTLRLWVLGRTGGRLVATFDHRTGDIKQLGVSRDGRRVAFDQGKTLRLLSLPDGLTAGVLQSPSAAANFSTLALFSPDSRLLLTAGASEGPVQLWRAPDANVRGHELWQLVSGQRGAVSCAAFAPDGSFIVTAVRDRVFVWPMPTAAEVDHQQTAQVTFIERAVGSAAGQVRLWAELPNLDGSLLPGTSVTVVVYPGR